MIPCPVCGNDMPALTARKTPRQICSKLCAAKLRVHNGWGRDELVNEVEFLTSCGTSPAQIVNQIGIQPGSIAKSLTRAGRRDLARPFWPLKQHYQHAAKDCADCGTRISGESTRCRPCANRHNAQTRWRRAA